jgi:hypothetical protein
MKAPFRNPKFLILAGLSLLGIGLLSIYLFRPSTKELTPEEWEQVREARTLTQGRVQPTAYAGIFDITGERMGGAHPQRVHITTHLDEAQLKAICAQPGMRVGLPGQGLHAQWINIISTLVVAGLVVFCRGFSSPFGAGEKQTDPLPARNPFL